MVVCVCVCRCETPGRDDYGSKWSMSALLRHLHKEGKDVTGEIPLYSPSDFSLLSAHSLILDCACSVNNQFHDTLCSIYTLTCCTELIMKVEDVVIKAIIAGESHISSACDVFQTYKGNCFGQCSWSCCDIRR